MSPKPEEGAINQTILPIIPKGATPINGHVGVINQGGRWVYTLGMHPIYEHGVGDLRCFRLTVAQLINTGVCRSCQIMKTFGISKSSIDRAVRKLRDEGIEGFFAPSQKPRRGSALVLTPEVLARAQGLLDEGLSVSEVAVELGVVLSTLRRAVWDGRLINPVQKEEPPGTGSDKSERSYQDAKAADVFGTGCTRVGERLLATMGVVDGVVTQFEHARHVPLGGVLCALGALLGCGLLSPVREVLGQIKGYYSSTHILLLLGFMSLCRIKTTEQLRSKAPGELGKLMGLDRIPEVRCLRQKLDAMSADGAAEKWAAALAKEWMEIDPDAAGTLYVDGHVRVYHGSKNKLPRKYVSRQRLCLRGTTDYWVNDEKGRPFFVIDKVVDAGLLAALREDIVPRLLIDVPGVPSKKQLAADATLSRFTLVFDREAYSPVFFKEMWEQHRIACTSYHKYASAPWPVAEFTEATLTLVSGEEVTMKLAERGAYLGESGAGIWMREVRKLTESGHQTSLISTEYQREAPMIATGLLSRWCQENFFRYMIEHFKLDLLGEYRTEPLHDTEKVINPEWRKLERQRNSLENKLRYRRARFAAQSLADIPGENLKKLWQKEKQLAELLEEITALSEELKLVKEEKKATAHRILWKDLSEKDRFERPAMGRKRLLDAVHMIAYRAETALCSLLRSPTIDNAAARNLLQTLFVTEADIRPDLKTMQLHIGVHRGSRPAIDRSLETLFTQHNEAETTFPGTELVLHYALVGSELAKKSPQSVTPTS